MKIDAKDIAWLCSFPLLMSAGQMLFKRTVLGMNYNGFTELVVKVLHQPLFYIAIMLYAFSTFFWLWILGKYTLSLAYTFAVISVVFVPIFEFLLFGTRTNVQFWVGVALLVGGLAVIANSQSNSVIL